MTINLDIETTSGADLKKCGVYVYAADPDFAIQLLAYSIDGGPVQQIDFTAGEEIPTVLRTAILNPNVAKRAYNASFERVCLSRHMRSAFERVCLPRHMRDNYLDLEDYLDPVGWECTLVRASASGLPGSLDEVGKALGLGDGVAKKDGKRYIKLFAVGRANPADHPDDWAAYCEYNKQDVVAEMAIRAIIDRECPFTDQAIYELDQRINDTGVMLDIPFIETVIGLEAKRRAALEVKVKSLTWLKNPNSPAELLRWLNATLGLQLTSADKATLSTIETEDPIASEVLAARRELSLSSVKKFTPMRLGASEDGRARGLFRCYGAGRTARWSSVRIQLQNLARGDGKLDLGLAKNIIGIGNLWLVEACYSEPMAILSSLVRPALIPSPDNELVIGDFSSIEACVLAWYADEKWKLDIFNKGGAIYEEAASRMFNVPIEKILAGRKNKEAWADEMRQKGKVAELACIAEGQLVLTDAGLVPIQDVTTAHRLWDGVTWVSHSGVIFKGIKKTLAYDGLIATEDHLVWVEGQGGPIPFGHAAASGQNIVQSGSGGEAIRLRQDTGRGAQVSERVVELLRVDGVRELPAPAVDVSRQSYAGKNPGVPTMQPTQANTAVAGSQAYRSETKVREPKRCRLSQLRSAGYRVQIQLSAGSGATPHREVRSAGTCLRDRSKGQQQALRSGQPAFRYPKAEPMQQTYNGYSRVETGRLALRLRDRNQKTQRRYVARANNRRRLAGRPQQAKKLARDCGEAKVYDILNAGPRNRFTVSDKLVHNCGYQGGVGAFVAMGGERLGMTEDGMRAIVNAWRATNPRIVAFWRTLEEAAKACMRQGVRMKGPKGLIFSYKDRILKIQLPSGRSLVYRGVRLIGEKLSYEGYSTLARVWGRQDTYGGKICENIVQATARDCLADAMLRADAAGYNIVMHVHDEIVADMPVGTGSAGLKEIMSEVPAWATGLPLGAKVEVSGYYTK